MFQDADPEVLMNPDDYAVYQSLPDTITVYRGVIGMAEDSYLGLSWSLNQETAEWFAKRFGHRGYVYEGQIDKKYVYAYFSGRNESEVVMRPKYLRGLKKHRVNVGKDEEK